MRLARSLALVVFVLGFGSTALAAIPRYDARRPQAKTWVQGELRKTSDIFDFGIQGRGFFALQMPDGRYVYTREGSFYLDPTGYIMHKTLGGRLLVVDCETPDVRAPIALGERMSAAPTRLKGLRVDGSGVIEGVFVDGSVKRLARVELANFRDERKLKRAAHEAALLPTLASGDAAFGPPQSDLFGSVRAATLENVEQSYEASLD